jgi:4-hydroxythreonine-4-phosphate dehydrogenase
MRAVPGGKARGLRAPAAERAAGAPARLAVTVGDPRGVGPEVVAKALADVRVRIEAELVIVGPEGAGVQVGESVGKWRPGADGPEDAGRLAGLAVERAVSLARSGDVEGIVTAPDRKSVV